MVDRPRVATATFGPTNLMFVSSVMVAPGAIGGVAGGDRLCNDLARDAGLPGNFVIFLPTDAGSARSRVGNARGWLRPDGLPFMDTMAAAYDEHATWYPPRITERGEDVARFGQLDDLVMGSEELTCANWTSDAGATQYSFASGSSIEWRDAIGSIPEASCATPLRFYCFGVDHQALPALPAATGRFAFLSFDLFRMSNLAGADALCAGEAADAGLPGFYRALLASSGGDWMTRFDAGARWVRPDGVVFAENAASLLANQVYPSSTLSVTARGTHGRYPGWVWIGTAASNCSNWTLPFEDAGFAATGDSHHSGIRWGLQNFSSFQCTAVNFLYCLQL